VPVLEYGLTLLVGSNCEVFKQFDLFTVQGGCGGVESVSSTVEADPVFDVVVLVSNGEPRSMMVSPSSVTVMSISLSR